MRASAAQCCIGTAPRRNQGLTPAPLPPSSCAPVPQPEQIRQCLVDYASINVWQLSGADGETPSIVLAAA